MKRIILEYGKIAEIAKVMDCTRTMVSLSLNYRKNSFLARKIRHVAKTQFEGIEVGE
ncbi:hypothetical protein [Palleniella muris]|uniref:hypothetical protein n=1 Tax=Palleniella muris TaxID=3038145 RepID=UPI00144102C0|nr:hypothetical protein [Palleniella muris]